ncbi:PAN domain-containing protein [Sorangium sp. So ce426]|uniref:PAN domain-containing protein n=1 Tax=unclassified Sorangium TaxID=2621164 RepID=UPI003F5BF577
MKRVAFSLMFSVLIATTSGADADEYLASNEYMFPGQRLTAPSCYYHVDMQSDGNLVIYGGQGTSYPIWATNTVGWGGYVVMQPDGNLVMYDWSDAPVWSTDTWGYNYSSYAIQNDGNSVVYSSTGYPLWDSDTYGESLGQSPCSTRSVSTQLELGWDRPGGDYIGYYLNEPRASHCAYFCSQDSQCKAFTYVPPGVQGTTAVCWLKSSVPGASYNAGMVSGRILRD